MAQTTAKTVCVVGAAGYVGSSLVKTLMERGYRVHATLRDPGDDFPEILKPLLIHGLVPAICLRQADNSEKTQPLLALEGAAERLQIFKADLYDENSFDSAIQGCNGVFHVGNPTSFSDISEDEAIEAAEKGVLNVMRSCSKAKTVKRVVYTSSIAAACPMQAEQNLERALEESTWTSIPFFRNHVHPEFKKVGTHLYFIYKTVAEQTAFKYGEENGIEVVSIAPGMVGGHFITSQIPMSCRVILIPCSGEAKYVDLKKFCDLMGGIMPLVHIDDVCDCQVFLMEDNSANGRHICVAASPSWSSYCGMVCRRLPHLRADEKEHEAEAEAEAEAPWKKKLTGMGFIFKHGADDILDEVVSLAQLHGILPMPD